MTSDKSPYALRTIGEVAEELGIAPHVLRFWESKFHQIKPQKRRGRRYYRPEDIKIITQIKALLYGQGYTIRGVQKFLSNSSHANSNEPAVEPTEVSLITISHDSIPDITPVANGEVKKFGVVTNPNFNVSKKDDEKLQSILAGLKSLRNKLAEME